MVKTLLHMGTISRKRKYEEDINEEPIKMPRRYAPTRKIRKYKKSSRRVYIPNYLATYRQRGPIQDCSFVVNSSAFTVVGPTNNFCEYKLDMSTILSNSQGFIVMREAYTLYKLLDLTIKLQVSDNDSLSYQFMCSYQYVPGGVYPALSESENQHENVNSLTKTLTAEKPCYFKGRWNALVQNFGTVLLPGYMPMRPGFTSTGGTNAGTMTGTQAGRLIVSCPAVNFSTQPTALRLIITARCQFAAPRMLN